MRAANCDESDLTRANLPTGRRRSPAIAALSGFLDGIEPFRRGHQRRSLHALASASSGERNGDGCGRNVIGHFGDGYDVVVAKREISADDLAARLLDGRAHRLKAVL